MAHGFYDHTAKGLRKVTVFVTEELHEAGRAAADKEGVSLTRFMEVLLAEKVKRKRALRLLVATKADR